MPASPANPETAANVIEKEWGFKGVPDFARGIHGERERCG